MYFITTCNKIFHSFSCTAGGAMKNCLPLTWSKIFHRFSCTAGGAMKNCLLLLLVVLLAMPVPTSAAEPTPKAAEPVPPSGWEKHELSIPIIYASEPVRIMSLGLQKVRLEYPATSISEISLFPDCSQFWNGQVYLESVDFQYINYERSWTTDPNNPNSWTSWLPWNPERPFTSTKFNFYGPSSVPGSAIHGDCNAPYLYLPWRYDVKRYLFLNFSGNVDVNPDFAGQYVKFQNRISINLVYWTNPNAPTIDAIGDAAQQIADSINTQGNKINNSINTQGNKINNNLNLIQTGISTVNGNLSTINTSIKNGFQETISNIGGAANNIINNANQNTQQIVQNQDKNTQQITQNQDQNTQKVLDQNSQFRDEDRAEAEGIGKVAQDFLDTNTAKVKNNFAILWEPIAFTQRMLSVFAGGSRSTTFSDYLDGVTGFKYNKETGCLDPVIDISQKARYGKAVTNTTVTFPAYVLPVINVKLWDEYTFDLTQLERDLEPIFNAIDVVSGCLCLYWFLGYLSVKFEEVYKE